MGNILNTFKRFIGNKNTVTILGIIAGIVVLFIGYNYRVSHAVETVTIPYAKKTISSAKEITPDMVGTMEVLQKMVNNNKSIISNINQVLNTGTSYCVSERTTVPTGSFFYTEQVKPCNLINSNPIKMLPDGYRVATVSVDILSTYGNTMVPGEYIDIYARMTSNDGKLIFGKFITKLPILDVRDSKGDSIYYDSSNNNAPAALLFGVPEDLFLLLSKARLLGTSKVELIPVPGNAEYSEEKGETRVSSQYLKDEILKYTLTPPDEEVENTIS